jgi:hypothetical protein
MQNDELPPTLRCPKCRQDKPRSAFKRYLTPAEAKYRGYSGERRVQIETRNCDECRPRRRKNIESFTTAELKKKAKRGEISPVLAALVEKNRTAQALAAQTAAANKRWEQVRLGQWKAYIEEVTKEIRGVMQQRKHARRTCEGNPDPAVLKKAAPIIAYCDGYLDILQRLKADLFLTMRRGNLKAPTTAWTDAVTAAEKTQVAALWSAIEPNKAAQMKKPAIYASYRFGVPLRSTDTQTNEPHTPPEEDSEGWDDF